MSLRKVMYVVIAIVCIVSIGIGVYTEENPSSTKGSRTANTSSSDNNVPVKTQQELRDDFDSTFDNKVDTSQYDTSNITKLNSSKDIVYTTYSLKEQKNNYDVDLNLPIINISGDVASKFNSTTQQVFANKANDILKGTADQTVYTVSYTGYINGDIMSVIIKSTIKEGSNAQRVMVQTYNYNLKTGKEATIDDIINQRGTNRNDVTKKINEQIQEAAKEGNSIQGTGYDVYTRDINNDMYKIDNVETYFLGQNGELYIVYAYGNKEFTSEMDIIVV